MLEHAVEAVGPQRAIGTRCAHVVNHDERVLVAEQFGELDGAAHTSKRVVLDQLRMTRRLYLALLPSQFRDLSAIVVEPCGRGLIVHRLASFLLAAIAVAIAHPAHRMRLLARLVASLRHQVEVLIRGVHHVEAARIARIGMEYAAARILEKYADAGQLRSAPGFWHIVVGVPSVGCAVRPERYVVVEVEVALAGRHPFEGPAHALPEGV